MLKNFLLTISLCFAMATGNAAVSPVAGQMNDESAATVELISDVQAVSEQVADEVAVEATTTSKVMNKVEKAENLKKNDPYGFALTVMAMVVTLVALIVLSILFLGFGKVSSKLQAKKKLAAQGLTKEDLPMEQQDLDSGEVIAAISMALAQHFDAHDTEDTVLTIKRMKRAYSPWNSKIYNMREVPMLRKNFK